jgi:F-type H+-transporting ATPase subunit b
VERTRESWYKALEKEKASFLRDLRQMSAHQVYAISRQALKELANMALEGQLIEAFLQQFRRMNAEEKKKIAQSASTNQGITVRSAFEIQSKMRRKITTVLREQLKKEVEVVYETREKMIAGIELRTNGRKIAWHLEDYLSALEAQAREALEEGAGEKQPSQREGHGNGQSAG